MHSTLREGVQFPFTERQIRGAVVMRKNSYYNRSEQGAQTQAILMSIFKTLQQRKYKVTEEMANALQQLLKTKK
ncbi:MAG: hypothetical protein LBU34_13700 [Planctomycetaceae bacterium]|nr:hypothetical protein [Planctomycetaceae bacterium]